MHVLEYHSSLTCSTLYLQKALQSPWLLTPYGNPVNYIFYIDRQEKGNMMSQVERPALLGPAAPWVQVRCGETQRVFRVLRIMTSCPVPGETCELVKSQLLGRGNAMLGYVLGFFSKILKVLFR